MSGKSRGKKRARKSRKSNNIQGPSKRDAPEENPSEEGSPEENPSEEGSGPEPCLSSREVYCFSRILTPDDVMPTNPELYILAFEACFLFDPPETKFLLVYDEDKSKSYSMLCSKYDTWDFRRYSISADWETFVADHNLKAGDKISFYKFVDKDICDGFFYVLKFVKKPSDGNGDDAAENTEKASDDVAEDKRKKKSKPGPGSRSMPIKNCCLSKILTRHEVLQENPKLYFDPRDAIDLTGYSDIVQHAPGTYSKDLCVFDKDDRQYTMKLSHRANARCPETSYCLNTGWGTFLRAHGLKEGDRLVFYRFFDEIVYKEVYYYALRSEPCVTVTSPSSDVASDDPTVELQRKRTVELQKKLKALKKKKAKLTALLDLCSHLEMADDAKTKKTTQSNLSADSIRPSIWEPVLLKLAPADQFFAQFVCKEWRSLLGLNIRTFRDHIRERHRKISQITRLQRIFEHGGNFEEFIQDPASAQQNVRQVKKFINENPGIVPKEWDRNRIEEFLLDQMDQKIKFKIYGKESCWNENEFKCEVESREWSIKEKGKKKGEEEKGTRKKDGSTKEKGKRKGEKEKGAGKKDGINAAGKKGTGKKDGSTKEKGKRKGEKEKGAGKKDGINAAGKKDGKKADGKGKREKN